jgi:SAM-dependent methyltransferase
MQLSDDARVYLAVRYPQLVAWIFVGLMGGILAVILAFWLGWWGLIPLAGIALGIGFGVVQAIVRFARLTQDTQQIVPVLWDVASLSADSQFILLDLGTQAVPQALATRLRYGHVEVIDIYNPQIAPDMAVLRIQQAAQPQKRAILADPRIALINGRIDLLPLSDASVTLVVTNQILSMMPAERDRAILIEEVLRVLRPGGKWVLCERVRPEPGTLLFGLGRDMPDSAESWHEYFQLHAFQLRQHRQINSIVICLHMQKQGNEPPTQLRFAF